MKLQLDTTNKTVKIENDIKVSQLIKTLKSLLPDDWKDFTLQTNVTINNWSSPIYIERHTYPYYYPWYCNASGLNTGSNITTADYSVSNTTCELKSGLFNIETNL